MVLTLNIGKFATGNYEVQCEGHAGSPTRHESISAALAHYGDDIPPDFARFVEVRYHGVSLGTTAVTRLAKEPELMATELVALVAAVYEANESMAKAAATQLHAQSSQL